MLEVEKLKVYFRTEEGIAKAVDEVSFRVEAGQTHVLVGESGCGKSVTALAITGLLPADSVVGPSGSIQFQGKEILGLSRTEMRKIRGAGIGMVFQEPMTALNPVLRIGDQIVEAMQAHPERALGKTGRIRPVDFRNRALEVMELCGLKDPEKIYFKYPHELSGGMRQRVVISIALSCRPDLIIADEPTTALDVTIQAKILELMRDLQKKTGAGILLITHDLGVVSRFGDTMSVMYAGQVVEKGNVSDIFDDPLHPYTISLFRSLPGIHTGGRQKLQAIQGTVPPATGYDRLPSACRFFERCPYRDERCQKGSHRPGHLSWCARISSERI